MSVKNTALALALAAVIAAPAFAAENATPIDAMTQKPAASSVAQTQAKVKHHFKKHAKDGQADYKSESKTELKK